MRLLLITGGSAGLGLAIANEYSSKQFKVVEFSRSGGSPNSTNVDLSDLQLAARVFAKTFENLATRDYLEVVAISNAGTIDPIGPAFAKDSDELQSSLNVNLGSGILFMTEFVRHFQNKSGRRTLVNITSLAATKAQYGWSTYCGAKAGTEHFARCLAVEQHGIPNRINIFSYDPGLLDTEMQRRLRGANIEDFPLKERFIKLHADGRLEQPKEVAKALIALIEKDIEAGRTYSYVASS